MKNCLIMSGSSVNLKMFKKSKKVNVLSIFTNVYKGGLKRVINRKETKNIRILKSRERKTKV